MSEAFFGRRKGKALREGQMARAERLLPLLKLNLQQKPPMALTQLFPKPVSGVRLEIGFGGGEHLCHEVARCETMGFIGIEPFVNGMIKLLHRIDEAPSLQQRLRLYDDDATLLLDWLPDACLNGIDLFYPDPWPKKKHWKRRFVNEKNLNRFARVLKSGGVFRFVSDIDTYVNWTLRHMMHHPAFDWVAKGPEDWQIPFIAWPSTRYEAKALLAGRVPAYLTFLRL